MWGLRGISNLFHKVKGFFKGLKRYRIKLEEPDDAVYSASYSGESFTDSLRAIRKRLKKLDPRTLRKLKLFLEALAPIQEVAALSALIGGAIIVSRIASKYLSSRAPKELEDKLEDTWVAADGVYFASYGVSNSEMVKGALESVGVSSSAVEDVGDAVGGLTGLASGPAELALATMELKEVAAGKGDAEDVVDAMSYAGWGLGDLADGVDTLLELVKGASLAGLSLIGNLAYGLAGVMDALLGAFELRRALKAKSKRKVIGAIAEIVSGFGFTLSMVLPEPFAIAALIAVGIAEGVNFLSKVKVERVKGNEQSSTALKPSGN